MAIVATIMNNAERIFGNMDKSIGTVGFLMLFVLSTGVVGTFIIGKPIMLYIDNKKKEAVSLLIWILICLAFITLIVLLYLGLK